MGMSIEEMNRVMAVEIEVAKIRAQFADLKQAVDALVDLRRQEREVQVNKEARHGTSVRRGAEGRKQAS